jgi:hypothetical protein
MQFTKRKPTSRFSKKTARIEKLEERNALITALTKLSGKNLGLLAAFEPSIADALSVIRARDLE